MRIVLLIGIALVILSVSMATISGLVFETSQHITTHATELISTLTLQNYRLADIEEGETKAYSKDTESCLGNAVDVTTTEDNVYLNFTCDLDTLNTYYSTYNITVKYAAVGSRSIYSVGDTAYTMTLASPVIVVTLDKTGVWSFDFEITTIAKSVSSDQATTVTILVIAETA